MSPELAAVDRLLDDERFLAPFVARFDGSSRMSGVRG